MITEIALFSLGISVLFVLKKINSVVRECRNTSGYDLIADMAGYGVYAVDKNGHCSFVNQSALEILGISQDDILHKYIENVFCGEMLKSLLHTKESCPVFKTLEDKKRRTAKEHFKTKEGRSVHLSLSIAPLKKDGALVVFKDITEETSIVRELNKKNTELSMLVSTDALSGLYNRRYLDENLPKEYERALRGGSSFAVGICDIDNFKLYNDNYGHVMGDDVIRKVAQTLKHTFSRKTDIVARYGGEEFVFVLGALPVQNALKLVKDAKDGIEELNIEHSYSNVSNRITASFGVVFADIPRSEFSQEDILNMADLALYKSKNSGKNTITFESV